MNSRRTGSQNQIDEQLLLAFDRVCAEQLALCEALENVADQLGAQPNRQKCLQMAEELDPIMQRAHAFEANVLFPLLASIVSEGSEETATIAKRYLEQLKTEHEDDVGLVGEVVEALREFGQDSSPISSDAIGYLLRGLFVGLRRHLAYENQVVRTITQHPQLQ